MGSAKCPQKTYIHTVTIAKWKMNCQDWIEPGGDDAKATHRPTPNSTITRVIAACHRPEIAFFCELNGLAKGDRGTRCAGWSPRVITSVRHWWQTPLYRPSSLWSPSQLWPWAQGERVCPVLSDLALWHFSGFWVPEVVTEEVSLSLSLADIWVPSFIQGSALAVSGLAHYSLADLDFHKDLAERSFPDLRGRLPAEVHSSM